MVPPPTEPAMFKLIKSECGRAKYAELASRAGVLARLRLAWFVLIAVIRDWPLSEPRPLDPPQP